MRFLWPIDNAPARRIQDRIRKPLEWEKTIEMAGKNLITSALYKSFSSMNAFHALPEDLQDYLIEIHQRNAQRNRNIKEQVIEIALLFNKIGNVASIIFLRGFCDFVLLCRRFDAQINWSLLGACFDQAGIRKEFDSYLLTFNRFCGYQEPLLRLQIKNTGRLFLYQVNLQS
jgi:hypothetical protein